MSSNFIKLQTELDFQRVHSPEDTKSKWTMILFYSYAECIDDDTGKKRQPYMLLQTTKSSNIKRWHILSYCIWTSLPPADSTMNPRKRNTPTLSISGNLWRIKTYLYIKRTEPLSTMSYHTGKKFLKEKAMVCFNCFVCLGFVLFLIKPLVLH